MAKQIQRIRQGKAQKITAVLYHQGNMKRARGAGKENNEESRHSSRIEDREATNK